jgi:glucose-6-phosphate isomerase, archaeal
VVAPEPELRRLDVIRPPALNPACDGPDPVYAIAMDVGTDDVRDDPVKRNLLYGAVTYRVGSLGAEPVLFQVTCTRFPSRAVRALRRCTRSGLAGP